MRRLLERRRARRERSDRGTVSIEVVMLVPILVLVALLTLQLGVAWWAGSQAQEAARQAARAQSLGKSADEAARNAVPDKLHVESVSSSGGSVSVTVEVPSVSILPDFTVTREATFPGSGSR